MSRIVVYFKNPHSESVSINGNILRFILFNLIKNFQKERLY
jgi:hypothetical protein